MPRRSSTDSDRLGERSQKILHLDLFSGIAGNMFASALLDLGLSQEELESDLSGLGIEHQLEVSRVSRGALSARYLKVLAPGADPGHHHHDHGPHGHGGGGRHYREIVQVLESADLREPVRQRALSIFSALAEAAARVHGVSVDEVHFHEVGAVDAIVDVTAAAVGLDRLGVDRVNASPVALGEGQVETAHGLLPLPAPATLELLKGIPTVPGHVQWETVTPTGAAILRTIADEYGAMPAMTVDAIGLGAGNDREGPLPNVLRAVLGHSNENLGADRISVLEANVDDLNPEHFDYVMERLLEAGALDVSLQHIQMKKNRPGFLVRVLANPTDSRLLADILFAESGTLGVRLQEWQRWVLARDVVEVETPYGLIRVKRVRGTDGRISYSAEYDDCKQAALESGAPLRDVVASAETAARETRD
ncbi:MAG: nickel pincer cofactor biosynthesis protein LarC [Myxococcota bacterium]|nr:nickel pincer cofactor biosynthesis protein LarC [Myxococcota bacterium]